jgi:protein-disulfide isomerase
VSARVQPAVSTVLRVVLAAAWVWAAVATIGDPAATLRAVRAYDLLPSWLAQGVAYGLPFLELGLAVLLLLGLVTRLAAIVSAVVLAVLLAGVVSAAARGLQVSCGCFGGGGTVAQTSYPRDIALLAVLLLVAVALARWPHSRLALSDSLRQGAAGAVPDVRVGPRRSAEARRRLAEVEAARAAAGERRVFVAGVLSIALLVVATGGGIALQHARASGPAAPEPQAVSDTDGVTIGRADAEVTIDLYDDPQCTSCRAFESEADPALTEWIKTGRAKVRYHVLGALDGKSANKFSSRGANAAYCAADAGVFVQFHDLLLANQPEDGTAGPPDDQLVLLGRQAGASGTEWEQCVQGGKYADFVARVSDRASRVGVIATPAVFVDDSAVQPVGVAALTTAVNDAS